MKGFARVTKLSNVGGRADYISNPDRQESIVAASAQVDWKPYHDYEMAHQKTDRRNNEGREVVIALPNEWAALSRDELTRRVQQLAVTAAGKDTDMQWAVHWNKGRTNLHVHVIFSERQKEKEPGRWDRDIYLTDEGKVARRKADRAREPDGSFRPPVHRKGELKDGFTVKNPKYASRGWVPAMKQQLKDEFERMGVTIEKPQPLHEYHEGKGDEAPAIRAKNEAIRINNGMYAEWRRLYPQLKESSLKKLMVKAAKAGRVLIIHEQPDGQLVHGTVTVKAWNAAKEADRAEEAVSARVDPDPPRPSEKLSEAFKTFQEAQERLNSAESRLRAADKLPFWNKQKKPQKEAASRELRAAFQECKDAFDRVISFGVSGYRDGVKLSGTALDPDDMKYLSSHVERKIGDLEREEAHEAKIRTPMAKDIDAMRRYREQQKELQPAVEAHLQKKESRSRSTGPVR